MQYISHSLEETLSIGRHLAQRLETGANVALRGELGAGKTAFCKGLISELAKISIEEIVSPTFTLVEEYSAKWPIYHIDLYRIQKFKEAQEFPWEDYLSQETLCLIEWVENFPMLEKFIDYDVFIQKKNEETREIRILRKK